MLLQAITIDDRAYEVEKASRSFINTHIFPGGCLPSLEVIARNVARRTDMQMVALEDLTPHYVETLRRWQRNFARARRRARRRSGTTSASGACGRCTSPTARPGSPNGASATSRSRSPSRAAVPTGMCRFGRCGSAAVARPRNELRGWRGRHHGQATFPSGGWPPAEDRERPGPVARWPAGRVRGRPRPTRRRTGCAPRSGWRRLDGSSPPRRFTEGPADTSPRWSPDGRWLAYISVTDGQPDARSRAAGAARRRRADRLGDLPGPVSQLAWSPDSTRIVVVCRVGMPDRAKASAAERNAPRVVRGLAARLDGVGWQDGRRHLFVVDVGGRIEPAADPRRIRPRRPVVLPRRRHDRVRLRPSPAARRPPVPRRRLGRARRRRPSAPAHERARVASPSRCSPPTGSTIAFAGQDTDELERRHPRVRRSRRRQCAAAEAIAPGPRSPGRPVPRSARAGVLDRRPRAPDARRRPRLGQPAPGAGRRSPEPRDRSAATSSSTGVAARPGRRAVAFTALWPDRPSEVFVDHHRGRRAGAADPAQRRLRRRGRARSGQPVDRSPAPTAPRSSTSRCFLRGRAAGAAAASRRRPRRPARLLAVRKMARLPPGDRRGRLRRRPAQSARQHELRRRRSRAPAPAIGAEATTRTSSPAAMT